MRAWYSIVWYSIDSIAYNQVHTSTPADYSDSRVPSARDIFVP